MTEAPANKQRKKYWCFDGSSWQLIDDQLGPDGDTLFETYGKAGFELLLGPGEADDPGAHISLWTRNNRPECVISIFAGGNRDACTDVYADRLPDGIDLFTRWAPAIYGHGGEPEPSTQMKTPPSLPKP